MRSAERAKLSRRARAHAKEYDVDRVTREFMLPALAEVERRIEKRRKQVSVPARRKWSVAVVTPWRNHSEFSADYWAAVDAGKPDEVIIIDDGSEDPIENATFRFDRPGGYVRASNKGLELATADVVVFLNNDIRLVSHDWLDRIVELCEPGALVGELRAHQRTQIDGQVEPYIDGWCIAGMRTDLESLGGFDTTFKEPAYYCDNDLCLRASLAGMRLVDTVITGIAHKSNGTTNDDIAARELAAEANHALYAQRVRESRGLKAAA